MNKLSVGVQHPHKSMSNMRGITHVSDCKSLKLNLQNHENIIGYNRHSLRTLLNKHGLVEKNSLNIIFLSVCQYPNSDICRQGTVQHASPRASKGQDIPSPNIELLLNKTAHGDTRNRVPNNKILFPPPVIQKASAWSFGGCICSMNILHIFGGEHIHHPHRSMKQLSSLAPPSQRPLRKPWYPVAHRPSFRPHQRGWGADAAKARPGGHPAEVFLAESDGSLVKVPKNWNDVLVWVSWG